MYNSQYYTCEQIDQRLLQGYLDDYNSENNTNLTKTQFLNLLYNTIGRNTIIDNLVTQVGYYECNTAAGTAAKAISATGYVLSIGGSIKIKMTNANTADNVTLNINSTGAKPLYYNGKQASASNSWKANEVISVFYDGSSFISSNFQGGGGAGDGAYDVSDANDGATYDNLSAALAAIPVNDRKGGMSVKFILRTNTGTEQEPVYKYEYVQYRLMTTTWSDNVADWQGVDDEPKEGSKNLVQSGGVYNTPMIRDDLYPEIPSDLDIVDENGNAIVRFINGHIKTKMFNSGDVPEIRLDDDPEDYDFAISDEEGFQIVLFKNGHIRTRNFNSENIPASLLAKFEGKKFAFIGDSISTYNGWLPSNISGYDGSPYASYYPGGNVRNVEVTWWYKTLVALGISPNSENCNNCSWSGSKVTGDSDSTTNASAGCSERRISDLSIRGWVPDIIIVFISCNDWNANVQLGSWQVSDSIPTGGVISEMRASYALMLNKIHTVYPMARVFCCTILDDFKRDKVSGWPSNNAGGVTTYQWNENIKEIAHAFGCDVIDMHSCGVNYSNVASLTIDAGLHPNVDGMELMSKKVVSELIAKY